MKTFRLLICLLVLGALLFTSPLAVCSPAPLSDKPTIYEFARKFCPVCREMEVMLKEVEAEYRDQINLRILYIDTEEPLFREYRVSLVPTQVFLDASGQEVFRHEGPLSKEKLVQKLKELKFIRD